MDGDGVYKLLEWCRVVIRYITHAPTPAIRVGLSTFYIRIKHIYAKTIQGACIPHGGWLFPPRLLLYRNFYKKPLFLFLYFCMHDIFIERGFNPCWGGMTVQRYECMTWILGSSHRMTKEKGGVVFC